jgi:predicted glycosyltransferase involved in capsule biosynthesis
MSKPYYDLTDATFIIPLRIDSQDRLRNIITSLCYIHSNFITQVLVKEVSEEPIFGKYALPQISDFCGEDFARISYEYVKSDNPVFHRQKIINEMLDDVQTDITVNYDCDVLLPLKSYVDSVEFIRNGGADVVYPYGDGLYQKQVFADDDLVTEFLNNDFDFSILEKKSKDYDAKYGFVQFFNTESYIEGGGENENFVAYAPEDVERYYRFTTLGYNVKRLDNLIYHLEHNRTPNSWFTNPHREQNELEWAKVSQMDKEQLLDYVKNGNYFI